MKFEIVFGNERLITPSGLALAGLLLKKTNLRRRLNNTLLKENANPVIKKRAGPAPDAHTNREKTEIILPASGCAISYKVKKRAESAPARARAERKQERFRPRPAA